jgi:hypothetical protein
MISEAGNTSKFHLNNNLMAADTVVSVSNEVDSLKAQEAQTARFLAIALSSALGASVILQYTVLAVLACRDMKDDIPVFEHLFNSWLPVISGLTSSAVTYYLTRRPTRQHSSTSATKAKAASK